MTGLEVATGILTLAAVKYTLSGVIIYRQIKLKRYYTIRTYKRWSEMA